MILVLLKSEYREQTKGYLTLAVQEGKHFVAVQMMLVAQKGQNWGDATGQSIEPPLKFELG